MAKRDARKIVGRDGPIALPEVVRALVVAHRALVTSYAATDLCFTLDVRLVSDIAEATAPMPSIWSFARGVRQASTRAVAAAPLRR
jgi:hypothetical protein